MRLRKTGESGKNRIQINHVNFSIRVYVTFTWHLKIHIYFQGYIENARQCSTHGTYKCGICECAPDYFGRRCECDAENLNFHGDLEAGCRPDNTTTTLCNNRGDCICGKCECYPRENPQEVRNWVLIQNILIN